MKQVFFRRLRINESTGTATIIVSSDALETKTSDLLGFSVGSRTQNNITFGVLSLVDPQTGKAMSAKHPTILALQKKLNVGDALPGFQLSNNPVVNRETGEETGLFWVEAV